ncbi:MAG TPA: hypothetical protein DCL77_02230 [Prolixibacteraceae bacterium]|jgi:hypothetical protein|nr:hypothetical protein [Prolixibacteraceae bacterium]
MERYLEQLMDDLQQAIVNLKSSQGGGTDFDHDQESLDFSQVEKYEYGEVTPISEITGIQQEQLPPVEKLNEDQQALLAAALEDLLQHFHFELDFPRDYPLHLRYAFIRQLWSEEQVAVTFGNIHIEFCDYDEENCPFPGYCNSCQEASEYMKNYIEHGSKANAEDMDDEPCPYDISDDEGPYRIDINELNDAHGNRIDLNSIPLPGLCVICNKYRIDDWDENLLCLMNRNDQSDQLDFECGGFEKI